MRYKISVKKQGLAGNGKALFFLFTISLLNIAYQQMVATMRYQSFLIW